MFMQAITDHYRCPEEFLEFMLKGELSSQTGFFRLGPDVTCYGRAAGNAVRPSWGRDLKDVSGELCVENGKLQLPFDPTELINNLRLERYTNGRGVPGGARKLLKELYYLVRPLTNASMRSRVQKFQSRDWKKIAFPQWPVDTTVEDFYEKLLLLTLQSEHKDGIPFIWFWPGGAPGCLMMTHDVETGAGLEFCSTLMDINDSFGIKSSFQVVPEERYPVPMERLEEMRKRGFEVVIHDLNHDGRLFDDREKFLRRAEKINHYVQAFGATGFRSGVLYRRPDWLSALKISFDMSMPNVAHLDPQRGGCCTVMPYFIGNIVELPLTTTQDYMMWNLIHDYSIDLWKRQSELILEKHGLLSFLAHPDYLIDEKQRSIYKSLLAYLKDLAARKNLWTALPSDLDSWWRARSQMSLMRDGNTWKVTGKGAEHAVVAIARNVDGKLVYELQGNQRP